VADTSARRGHMQFGRLILTVFVGCCLSAVAGELDGTPPQSPSQTPDFTSAEEAYATGRGEGYSDGIYAGLAAKQGMNLASEPLMEICQAPSQGRGYAFGADYDRGYRDGYEDGYRKGYNQGKSTYQGGGCGFGLGFFLGLIGVIIAAIMP